MKKVEAINWSMFKELLLISRSLDVQFQCGGNKLINTSYHITEIKQVPITSVDCGGVMNAWTEIIVQLWEPELSEKL